MLERVGVEPRGLMLRNDALSILILQAMTALECDNDLEGFQRSRFHSG